MSAAEEEQGLPPDVIFANEPVGELSVDALYEQSSPLRLVTNNTDAERLIDGFLTEADDVLPDEQAAALRATWSVVQGGLADGEIDGAQVPDFWRWLRYDKGVGALTAGLVAGGYLGGRLLDYATAHGYSPPVVVGPPPSPAEPAPVTPEPKVTLPKPPAKPAPLPKPTEGDKAVNGVAVQVKGQAIPVAGLTQAQANAITKALSVALADASKVTAGAIDAMLPGLKPGQVPEALTDLFRATTVIERQVLRLMTEVHPGAPRSLVGRVSGVSAALVALRGQVAALEAEMAAKSPSGLLSELEGLKRDQAGTEAKVSDLERLVPGLATVANVSNLRAEVNTVVEELDLKHASALDTALNGVEHTVADLARQARDNEECCTSNTSNLADTIKSLGGKSALASLGQLAKRAFELTALMTLLETVATIINAPLAVSAMVTDTENVSAWATTAASTIAGNLGNLVPTSG